MSANALAKVFNVTPDTALRLARYFGTDARSWMNLQVAYDFRMAEIAQSKRIAATIRLRAV
jgi:antitoxin HigA-1